MTGQPHQFTGTAFLVAAWLISLFGTHVVSAGTSAEARVERIKADIAALRQAVVRGDKPAVQRAALSIEGELATLHTEILTLPPLRLAVRKETATFKYLGSRIPSVQLAGALVTQDGIAQDLAALSTHVVADRHYRVDDIHEVSVRYYPPGELYVVQDVLDGKSPSQLDFLSLLQREQRLGSILARAIDLETAWRRADRLTLAVETEIAERLGLGVDGLRVRFLQTGVVLPESTSERTHADLLQEVKNQLEYIVNVKPEGPPLLAVLRTGLFFNEEFGFEAWGGRWPEFTNSMFLLRYEPNREEFLVRLRRLR